MNAPRVVHCPSCGGPVRWMPESTFRPFCSERCKLMDLGGWATERYRVAGPEVETPGTPGPAGQLDTEGKVN